jgi:hypothetical protein
MAERQGKESARGPAGDRADTSVGEAGPGPGNALPDLVRKALSAGFSSFFITEEAIRKALGDTLPKDWSDFAVEQSNRARAEFLERLSYEIGRAMESVDYATVLAQLLEGRTLEVSARIKLLDEGGRSRRPRLRFDVSNEDEDK